LWPNIALFGSCDDEGKSINKFSILHQPIQKLAFSIIIILLLLSHLFFFLPLSFPTSSWLR
jgi:hypothetical protein